MKLCQKCVTAVTEATGLTTWTLETKSAFTYDEHNFQCIYFYEEAPVSECEFWAHKTLNMRLCQHSWVPLSGSDGYETYVTCNKCSTTRIIGMNALEWIKKGCVGADTL